jgi:copper chaperone CopZ
LVLHVDGMKGRHDVRYVTGRLRDVSGVEVVTADPTRSLVHVGGSMTVDAAIAVFAGSHYLPRLVAVLPEA